LGQIFGRLIGLLFIQGREQGTIISPEGCIETQFNYRMSGNIAAECIQQVHQTIGSFVKVLVNFLPELLQLRDMFFEVHIPILKQFSLFCQKSNCLCFSINWLVNVL